jgi:ABC-type nitrate/sulfonate/bicarbonate transport system permease component
METHHKSDRLPPIARAAFTAFAIMWAAFSVFALMPMFALMLALMPIFAIAHMRMLFFVLLSCLTGFIVVDDAAIERVHGAVVVAVQLLLSCIAPHSVRKAGSTLAALCSKASRVCT